MKKILLLTLLSLFLVNCNNDDYPFDREEKQDYDQVRNEYLEKIGKDLKGYWHFKEVEFNDMRVSDEQKSQMLDIDLIEFKEVLSKYHQASLSASIRVSDESIDFIMPIQPFFSYIENSSRYRYTGFYAFEPFRYFYQKDIDHFVNNLFFNSYIVKFDQSGDLVFTNQNKDNSQVLKIILSRKK